MTKTKHTNSETKENLDSDITPDLDPSIESEVKDAEVLNSDTKASDDKSMELDRSLENTTVDSESGIPYINDEDEDRLVIAEDEQTGGKQPTRSGNIQNRTYVCNLCEFSSTSAKIFLHHQKDAHNSDIIIYECDICEYATKYKQKLPRHRKLHFSGKDNMLSGSDLDSSYGDREKSGSFSEMIRAGEVMENLEQTLDDDEDDMEEEEEEEELPVAEDAVEPAMVAINGAPIVEKKKRKTRQEVDPGKYFEVLDDTGVKYACSRCGNVYKWRKSLNKHWKEKHHDDEMPDTSQPPPGLAKLSQLTHVKYRFPAVEGKRSPSTNKAVNRSEACTPVSMMGYMGHREPHPHSAVEEPSPSLMSSVVMPRFIGPFITDTVPVFPTVTSTPTGPMIAHRERALDMTSNMKMEEMFMKSRGRSSPSDGEQPIDFSVKKEPEDRYSPSIRPGLQLPLSVRTGAESPRDIATAAKKDDASPVLQCNRCGFVAKTLVDYSSHMTLHLNKRAFKCAECQEHFNGVDELNKHFGENHSEKIHEHKEAIQKIPHGLQQTYHLLKMPLSAIGNISSQDVPGRSETGDSKYLKCSMCSFVAKWPAELQKHAVSHSEERPFVCMVCGSTYKWKWDLVKHFEKSHNSLPNPYKRREPGNSSGPPTLPKAVDPNTPMMKSPLSTVNLYGAQPPLYPMTSTAAALIDTDSFRRRVMEPMPEEEPLKKKRRLSDTDMPTLDEEGSNSNDSYSKQREMFIMAGALDNSVKANDSMDDIENLALHHAKMSAASTLREMENLIPSDDSQSRMSEQEMYSAIYGSQGSDFVSQVMSTSGKMKKRLDGGKSENGRAKTDKDKTPDIMLPYKCQLCEYRARWPSEITQHMKNHSDEKPYHCPRCSYKSKWKWDVVKHLKRCGGGTIKDVIDTSKQKKQAPPNVTVMPQGAFQHPPPTSSAYNTPPITKPIPQKYAMSSVAEALTSNSAMMAMAEIRKAGYEAGKELVEREYMDRMAIPNGYDEPDNAGQQPIFRSLINQGVYHCLECPFIANSPAELRRHGVLHSENKPFACRVCGYSSRWKCDLKKHMKTYNHYDGADDSQQQQTSEQDKMQYQGESESSYIDDLEKDDRTLYKCSKCPYVTYKKFSYEIHVKIHGDVKKEEGGASKFKCKQCDYQAQDLPSFLQHKRMHMNGPPISQSTPEEQTMVQEPPSNDQVSNRTLQKHRRKPIQQFRCSKCPYTCFKRSGLEMHESMHEPRGGEAHKCLYCNYNVYSRGLLVQHMKLHPEFDINDYQDMLVATGNDLSDLEDEGYDVDGQGSRDEECMVIDDAMDKYNKSRESPYDRKLKEDAQVDSGAIDLTGPQYGMDTKSSAEQILLSGCKDSLNPALKFACEWCGIRFPNLVTVYQHAAASHPNELRAQEIGETPSMPLPTRQNDPYLERQKRLQQKQEMQHKQQQLQMQQAKQRQMLLEQHHQQQQQLQSSFIKNALSQQPRYRPIEPKPAHSALESAIQKPTYSMAPSIIQSAMQKSPHDPNNNKNGSSTQLSHASTLAAQSLLAKAKKSTSPNKRGRSFQCTKCSFTAPNAVTYLRHIERHGSNCRHTCRFCDYSIDRLNLLYQHMKGTHGDMWRGTPEEKISLTSSGKSGLHGDDMSRALSTPDCDSLNNSFNGTYSDMMAEFADAENSNDSLSSSMNEWRMIAAKGQKPILIVKEETIWRGTRIQICTINGKKNYKCPNCMFVSSNSSNMAYHVKQHGANKRFQCEKCDFTADSSRLILSHMESIHPKDPIFIEKIPPKVPFVAEGSVSPEENNNSRWENQVRSAMQILPTCTKCPYKCKTVEQLQKHFSMHGNDKTHKCEMCDYSVDTQEQLLKHLVVHRQPYEPDLTQEEEGSQTTSEVDHNQHQFLSKIELMPNNNRDSVISGGKKLTSQALSSVVSTAIRSSGRLRYRCAGCPYFSYCKNNLIKHRKQHLLKSRFGCQLCDYSATRAFLLAQHMKFHENAMDTSKIMETKKRNFHDIFLDPFDEDGISVLKNTDIPDNNSQTSLEDEKDFSDENNDEYEEGGEFDDETMMEEFDEEEMAALERAEFEGFNPDGSKKPAKKMQPTGDGNESDDSLSEMDPMALQQQISLNMSGNLMAEDKIRYSCSMCPYRCNALRSFKCHIHMHGLNKKYICDYCNWSADRLNLLYQHRKVHAKVPGFEPSPEDIVFLNRNYALENNDTKMQHIDEVLYNNFNKFKKTEPDETKTTPIKMETTSDGKKLYMCKLCPFTCSNKHNFTYHKSLHKINARYTCTECSYSVDRWNLLSKHMQLHHNIKDVGQQNGYGSDDLANMKNYEAGSPEVEPQLYFNSGESPPESESDREEEKVQDLKCNRCPFSTPSKDQLKSHEHHHGIADKQMCPYCDFSARTESNLLEHVQLHFPSTKLDKESLRSMVGKRGEKLQAPEVSVVRSSAKLDGLQNGEPDSTTEQNLEKVPGGEEDIVKEKMEVEKAKTKVYVCQYCEREFEGKSLMLQHEKQHLIGSKF